MKKTYMLLAAALVGMTAYAAPKNLSVEKAGEVFSYSFNNDLAVSAKQYNVAKKADKANKPSTVAEMEGLYDMPYGQYMLNGADPYNGNATAYFTVGDTPTQILITGMAPAQTEPASAEVNFSAGTVTITAGQNVGYSDRIQDSEGNTYSANLVIDIRKANMETQKWDVTDKAVGVINEDGSISFEDYAIMFEWQGIDGYNMGMGSFKFIPKPFFKFNANEWVSAGKAQFTDGWINALLVASGEEPVAAVEVDAYVNAANNNIFCFMNPYNSGEWAEVNPATLGGKDPNGYIVVDTTEPLCVCVQTLVPSGFWLDYGEEGAPDYLQFYMMNSEGYKLTVNGVTPEEQIDEVLEVLDLDADVDAELKKAFSYREGNDIIIRNLLFGQTGEPLSPYWWTAEAAKDFTAKFVLDLSGIEDVEIDENAPVKYYNLQGMEVVNPAKGQLVIKTQGNKAQKVIIK